VLEICSNSRIAKDVRTNSSLNPDFSTCPLDLAQKSDAGTLGSSGASGHGFRSIAGSSLLVTIHWRGAKQTENKDILI
jgi:hypothetical protein